MLAVNGKNTTFCSVSVLLLLAVILTVSLLHSCDCNPIGSTNGQCDIVTGQCECQPGITGLHCERCERNFFGFSSSGCKRKWLCGVTVTLWR